MEWKTIDSAPRDEPFLGYGHFFREDFSYYGMSECFWTYGGIQSLSEDWGNVTHWMPLPPTPAEKKGV